MSKRPPRRPPANLTGLDGYDYKIHHNDSGAVSHVFRKKQGRSNWELVPKPKPRKWWQFWRLFEYTHYQ